MASGEKTWRKIEGEGIKGNLIFGFKSIKGNYYAVEGLSNIASQTADL